jgi:hypothetical protein
MQNSLNTIGCFIVSIAVMVGCFLMLGLFISGGVWIIDKVLPALIIFSMGVFLFNVFVCVPLAFFRRTKEFSGKAFFLSSYFYGVLLWLSCLVITFKLWGWVGIVIGLLLLGIGIVPIAIVATVIAGMWSIMLHIIVLIVVIWLTRTAGTALLKECYTFGKPETFDTPEYSNSDEDVIDVKSVNVKKD